MALAAVPLSVQDSKKAIRHIFPKLGGVTYSDGLIKSRRLKWMHDDVQVINRISAELEELGLNHQIIIPDPRAFNAWRGSAIAIHVSKALNYRDAIAGLVNPHKLKQTKRNVQFMTLESKHRILEKLLPYVTKEDEDLPVLALAQLITERVKEDLS